MIEINAHKIEDMFYDQSSKKYRVFDSDMGKMHKKESVLYKIKKETNKMNFAVTLKKNESTQNLIERKGLKIDCIVK